MKNPRNTYLVVVAVALLLTALFLLFQHKDSHATQSGHKNAGQTPPDAAAPARNRPSRESPREADRLLNAEGARTDVSLSEFPIKEYQHLRSPAGKAAGAPAGEAWIHVPSAGRRIAMEANQLGEFPTVETRLKDTIGIRVSLDAVKPGTPVRLVILDGGSFPALEGVSQVLKVADWRGVAFEYTTSANYGTHRVLLQAAGHPSRILDFNALESKDS